MMWNIKNCMLLWIFSKSAVLPPEMLFIDLRNPNKHLEYDESTSYDIQVTFSMIFQACSSLKMMWPLSVNSWGKFLRLIFREKIVSFVISITLLNEKNETVTSEHFAEKVLAIADSYLKPQSCNTKQMKIENVEQ